jgi:hypothetical protein
MCFASCATNVALLNVSNMLQRPSGHKCSHAARHAHSSPQQTRRVTCASRTCRVNVCIAFAQHLVMQLDCKMPCGGATVHDLCQHLASSQMTHDMTQMMEWKCKKHLTLHRITSRRVHAFEAAHIQFMNAHSFFFETTAHSSRFTATPARFPPYSDH